MKRRWLILFAVLLAALWAPLTSRAAGGTPINSYTLTALGDLGGGEGSVAYGINDAGQVVGISRPPITGIGRRAFLWQNGVMTDLGTLGGPDSQAYGINNSGQVVGWATEPPYVVRAFLWNPTTGMQDLGTLGGNASRAYGINDAGQVVGSSAVAGGTPWHPFLWKNGQMVDLGLPPGCGTAVATSINASGQVAGYGSDANSQQHAFLWTPAVPNGMTGTMTAIDPTMSDSAYGINGAGEAAGEGLGSDGTLHAALWDGAGAHSLPFLWGTSQGSAAAINDSRMVVGHADEYYEDPGYGDPDGPYYVPPSSGYIPHAFVWDNTNGTRDLSALAGNAVSLTYARAVNSSGQIAGDDGYTAYLLTPSPLPSRPNLGWPSMNDSRVTLSWSASSGAASYTVKRAAAPGGPYATIASGVAGTSYTDTAVVNGTYYYYVVSAVNAYGEGANSNEVWATPMPPPAAPTGLTAVPGDGQVTLTWHASEWAISYTIYLSTTPGGPYDASTSTGSTSYLVGNPDDGLGTLQNGTTYYFVVVAGNYAGQSGTSNEASATPKPPAPPSAPTGLAATAGDRQVSLSWSAAAGADHYTVKRATTSGGPYTAVISIAGASYTDSGLTNGTRYYYVVSAGNTGGESANSAEVSATPTGPPPPAAPTKLTASAGPGKGKVTLKWTQSVSSNVTQNRIYRATTSGGPYSLHTNLSAGTSYTDYYVTSGVTYYYAVTAVDSSGKESAYSNQASAKAK